MISRRVCCRTTQTVLMLHQIVLSDRFHYSQRSCYLLGCTCTPLHLILQNLIHHQ